MINSNLQREHILPSERAWSFRKLMEVKRRQGFRSDISEEKSTSGTEFTKLETLSHDRTTDQIGEEAGLGECGYEKRVPVKSVTASFCECESCDMSNCH